jgi:hypothetical protein
MENLGEPGFWLRSRVDGEKKTDLEAGNRGSTKSAQQQSS